MGIDLGALTLLSEARKGGEFGKLVQIGRQGVHIWETKEADRIARECGFADFVTMSGGKAYADEGLLQALGASSAIALDVSAYEGAKILHDMNEPLPAELHQEFDTVFDGGSLEHIFNVPGAIANMMNLVKPGGRLISVIPANNWLGHGFYQFGPEFAFRAFSRENGFACEQVYLALTDAKTVVMEQVFDSGSAGIRGEIGSTRASTYLMCIAKKLNHVQPFKQWPQQGDYSAVWADPTLKHQDSRLNTFRPPRRLSARIAGKLRRLLRRD